MRITRADINQPSFQKLVMTPAVKKASNGIIQQNLLRIAEEGTTKAIIKKIESNYLGANIKASLRGENIKLKLDNGNSSFANFKKDAASDEAIRNAIGDLFTQLWK